MSIIRTESYPTALLLKSGFQLKKIKLPLPTSQAENDALTGAASQANYWLAIAQFRDFNDTMGNTRSVQDPWYNVNTGEIWASEGLGKRFEISYITIICITGTTE